MNTDLPVSLLQKAFRASNGELAWTRSDAIEAAKALTISGMAILGGEVWLTDEDGHWQGNIPQADGGPDGIYAWELEPSRRSSETWQEFCARARDHTLLVLGRMNVERDVAPELRPKLRYNLTYVTQVNNSR